MLHKTRKTNTTPKQKVGERFSEGITTFMGSWRYINIQTLLILVWLIFNALPITSGWHFDPPPYLLLSMGVSVFTVFTYPFVMMSQNRQSDQDRYILRELHRIVQASHQHTSTIHEVITNTQPLTPALFAQYMALLPIYTPEPVEEEAIA